MTGEKTFAILADSIREVNTKAGNAAKSAVNQLMTLRNWAIGYYIVEYEQGGKDRSEYGSNLMESLEKSISEKGMNVTFFKACRHFYLTYPQIRSTVSNELGVLIDNQKSSTVADRSFTRVHVGTGRRFLL